ncbi:MAG: hypothetical protein R2909_15720 [Gemmatimonadales bacterium]
MNGSTDALLRELERGAAPARERRLLDELTDLPLDPSELARYHDSLLFVAAYPRSEAAWKQAHRELAAFDERIARLDEGERAELVDSGIVETAQVYPYGLGNARWMAGLPGCRVEIEWSLVAPAARRRLAAIVRGLLRPIEARALDEGDRAALGVRRVLDRLRGRGTAFDWLSGRLRRALPGGVDQLVFDATELPLRIELSSHGPNRTLDRDRLPGRPALYDPAVARAPVAVVEEIKRPLRFGPPVPLERGRELLRVIRGLVLSRGRELHAMTHGNPDEVYHARIDRGATLTLWMMTPAERLPLEVGWYFMLCRNGIPLAYGGGGMFATRAEIGMNLFDPYRRSGEARWIFSQIARAVYSFCPVPWIVTRRYQIGGDDNDEGLASGAYWFYDKLGFRSVDPAIRALADRERALRATTPGHRTAKRLLRRLASADVALPLDGQPPGEYREFPLDRVGLALTRAIESRFGPERAGLAEWSERRAGREGDPAHRRRRGDTALFELITEPAKRSAARRAARLKGGRFEGRYARALPSLLPWLESLVPK